MWQTIPMEWTVQQYVQHAGVGLGSETSLRIAFDYCCPQGDPTPSPHPLAPPQLETSSPPSPSSSSSPPPPPPPFGALPVGASSSAAPLSTTGTCSTASSLTGAENHSTSTSSTAPVVSRPPPTPLASAPSLLLDVMDRSLLDEVSVDNFASRCWAMTSRSESAPSQGAHPLLRDRPSGRHLLVSPVGSRSSSSLPSPSS